jgi:hypothetical protein
LKPELAPPTWRNTTSGIYIHAPEQPEPKFQIDVFHVTKIALAETTCGLKHFSPVKRRRHTGGKHFSIRRLVYSRDIMPMTATPRYANGQIIITGPVQTPRVVKIQLQ